MPKNETATYQGVLKIESTTVATITLQASSDADAKKQLEKFKPQHFEGMGEWTLTKTSTVKVI